MKSKTFQSSFLTGVIDSRASGRVDTDAYNSALLIGRNVVVDHLGGVKRRPGLKYIAQLPGVLTLQEPDSVTTPEGGTGANGYDDDPTTLVTTSSNVSTTDPFVVIRYDLGSAVAISHADVLDFVATGGTTDEFRIQYSSNDSTWTDFGDPLPTIDTTSRSYRRSALSGGQFSTVSARYWRVAKVGGTDMGSNTVSLSGFHLWVDSGAVSNVRLFSYERSTSTRYLVAVTDRSATLLLNGAIGDNYTVPLPYESADLPDLDGAVGEEALFFAHEDYPVRYVFDEFSGEDFQTDEFPFTSLPQYDYNDSDSPTPTSEVQVITFDANWAIGDTFQIELDGARTGLISFAGDSSAAQRTTTAANIAREVQKLYSVPGFTGVSCSRTGSLAYTVTFAGSSAKPYTGLMVVTVGTTSSSTTPTAAATRSATGVARQEDVWSATRGYPRTITFFGGRMYLGGTRSKLTSLFGSAVNDIGSFELSEQLDADPIFVTLNNGQQLNAIEGVFGGRSLELFTSGGEFRFVKPQGTPITPSDVPAPQTQYGARRIRPVSVDGATLFAQRLGKSIRDFRFDFEEDSYNSLGLSSLAPHLLSGVVDMGAWQGSSTDEVNLVYVVNDDGTVAVLNLRREADVRAWTHWITGSGAIYTTNATASIGDYTVSGQDEFKAVATTVEEVYFAVERDVNGTPTLFLEQTDENMYVDCGVNVTGGATDNVVHLTGETCRVRLQNAHYVLSDQTGGTVTPSETEYASSAIQVGLNFNPNVTPMPLVTNTGTGPNTMAKRRIVKPRVRVRNTLGLQVNGRPLPDRYYDVATFDDANPVPFTGNHTIEETTNWDESEDKILQFTQTDPLPMFILSIATDMESA